jgi:predicted nucleic acid-binding protein
VLDYENKDNPFPEISAKISEWKNLAWIDVDMTDAIEHDAAALMKIGLRQKDAAHIACAIASESDYFITTDKKIINKPVKGIKVVNPIDFVREYIDGK